MAPSTRPGKEAVNSDQRGRSHSHPYYQQPHRGAYGRYSDELRSDADEVEHCPRPSYHRQPHHDHGSYEETNPSTGFVRKGPSSRIQPLHCTGWLIPAIMKELKSQRTKPTRHLIRPVEPSSFSPQEVENYIRAGIEEYFDPDWKDLEDVEPEMLTTLFNFLKSVAKWVPNDDESIKKCFRNKCAEILRENTLHDPKSAGKSNLGPDQQSPKDKTHARKSKRSADWPNRDVMNQHEYYSSAGPSGYAGSKIKRGKREKLNGDHDVHGVNISNGVDTGELKNERRGKHRRAEDRFVETDRDEGYEAPKDNLHIPLAWDHSDDSIQEGLVPNATKVAEAIRNTMMDHLNAILPSLIRHALRGPLH